MATLQDQRVVERPTERRPVTPRREPLWLLTLAIVVAAAVVGVGLAILIGGGEEVAVYDRAAEHGGDTSAFVQDLRTNLAPTYVGADAVLDPDVPFEHGPFTSYVPDLRPVPASNAAFYLPFAEYVPRPFLGEDANLDPDEPFEHGPFTSYVEDLRGDFEPFWVGEDAALD